MLLLLLLLVDRPVADVVSLDHLGQRDGRVPAIAPPTASRHRKERLVKVMLSQLKCGAPGSSFGYPWTGLADWLVGQDCLHPPGWLVVLAVAHLMEATSLVLRSTRASRAPRAPAPASTGRFVSDTPHH